MKRITIYQLLFIVLACSSSEEKEEIANTGLYFPPINSEIWETVALPGLEWDDTALPELYEFLNNSGTKAFLILKDGRIAVEYYGNGSDQNSNLPWNSAGKTLSAALMGIAEQEGFLLIDDPSKNYLGDNWSSLTEDQENEILIRHHLTMTTGLDYSVENSFCYDPGCLQYLNVPGTMWYYHNAPYTLTQDIITGAVPGDFNEYFQQKIKNPTGMQGSWIKLGYNHVFFSNARSMARFGLLNLNNGTWDDNSILNEDYYRQMVNSSQSLNKSYGFLWWLNGKSSVRLPESTSEFPGPLIPNAPADLIAGLGLNDQKLYVVKSLGLVIVRMGDNGDTAQLGPSSYDNLLWEKINIILRR